MAVAGAIFFTIGALFLTLWALRWVQRRMDTGSASSGMEILGRLGVAQRQGVALLRVGERVLLVSVGDGGVRTLTEFSAEEATALVASRDAAFPTNALPRVMERVREIAGNRGLFQAMLRREIGQSVTQEEQS